MDDSRVRMGASSFTHNGDYFALLSIDGRLRIWDTTSGKIVQEFSPSSVVQSSCTCLCWTRRVFSRERKKLKRKQKKNKGDDGDTNGVALQSLAIGTDKGFLFCYNPLTGEIEKLNPDDHSDKINCIIYHENEDAIYTCSDDKFIVERDAKKQQIKSKWKADKRAVKRICLGPSGTTLLSSGYSIKLWNLETKELLQSFNGHSSPISLLQFSPFRQELKEGNGDDGYYFVSGSTEDRVINAWQVNLKNPEMMAVASFILSDVAIFMDIILDTDDDKPLKLCVGCKDGRIHFFTCTMNGRTSRPIESAKTVGVFTEEGHSSSPVPFINARLHKDSDVKLTLVCGQTLKPSFKTLFYGELEVSSKIIMQVTKNILLSEVAVESDKSVEFAVTNHSTKFISDTAALPIPAKVCKLTEPASAVVDVNDDLQKTDSLDDLSMEERMQLSQPPPKDFLVKMKPKKSKPNAGSFAQMMIQALHSSDEKLIHHLLFNNTFNSKVLTNTVKRIPNTLVESLLRVVTKKLQCSPNSSRNLIAWLRTIVSVHLTYLMASEISRDALSGLYRLVKTHEDIHLPLLNLKGKIDLLCTYAENTCESDDAETFTTAAVVHNDSEDETEALWSMIGKPEEEMNEIMDSGLSDDDMKETEEDESNESEIGADKSAHSETESEEEEV